MNTGGGVRGDHTCVIQYWGFVGKIFYMCLLEHNFMKHFYELFLLSWLPFKENVKIDGTDD